MRRILIPRGDPAISVLSARSVFFSYADQPALEDVSFEVRSGEFVALVGPNGSGKSTLLKVLLGLLPPLAGEVRLFDQDPRLFRDRGRVGYVPQRPGPGADLPATVEEVVATGRLPRIGWSRRLRVADRKVVEEAISSVALLDIRDRPIGELSGGQQQRAFIARALASRPDLLVLDEPIAGIDAESQRRFRDTLTGLRDAGKAVLLVSHELGAVAEDLDRVLVLKRRVLFDGSPSDLAARGVSLGVHPEDLPLWLEGLR